MPLISGTGTINDSFVKITSGVTDRQTDTHTITALSRGDVCRAVNMNHK